MDNIKEEVAYKIICNLSSRDERIKKLEERIDKLLERLEMYNVGECEVCGDLKDAEFKMESCYRCRRGFCCQGSACSDALKIHVPMTHELCTLWKLKDYYMSNHMFLCVLCKKVMKEEGVI